MVEISVVDILIIVLKAALVMGALLHLAAMVTWVERKGSALIQNRVGANRAAIFGFDLAGILNTLLCDPVKAITKEDFLPKGTTQFMHSLAPFLAVFPIVVSFAVVPFGPPIQFADRTVSLQLADLNVGLLYVFAMGSLAVYGVVLAGWVSNNKFALFGSLRATAQMISYEVTMGLSIVGLIAAYQTLDLNSIVQQQSGTIFGFLPKWGIFFFFPLNVISFFLFFTSMMAETKRAPFDLPESESELAAGYFTEYSGMKFLLFWLGEFAEIVVASSIITVLFFGGWQLPYIDLAKVGWSPVIPGTSLFEVPWGSILGAAVFGAKVSFFAVLQVVIRWTLPRFRYDQLMNLCWKGMLPLSLTTVVASVWALLYFGKP
ncbi:MAG: complex I subunit 1 family protein [Bdellovibrionota bacterium]